MMASGLLKMRLKNIAWAHATTGQAQDGVELPLLTGWILMRELFNEVVVLVVAHVKVFAIFGQHGSRAPVCSVRKVGVAHHDGVIAVRAGGDHVDRHTGHLLDALQVTGVR
jgi:hypothetical protein